MTKNFSLRNHATSFREVAEGEMPVREEVCDLSIGMVDWRDSRRPWIWTDCLAVGVIGQLMGTRWSGAFGSAPSPWIARFARSGDKSPQSTWIAASRVRLFPRRRRRLRV